MFSSSFAFYSANSWYKVSCSSASPNSRCHLSSCILAVLSLFSGSSWGVSSSQNTWNIWPKFCTAHQNNPSLSLALLSCCPLFGINFTCMLYFWWNCCCLLALYSFLHRQWNKQNHSTPISEMLFTFLWEKLLEKIFSRWKTANRCYKGRCKLQVPIKGVNFDDSNWLNVEKYFMESAGVWYLCTSCWHIRTSEISDTKIASAQLLYKGLSMHYSGLAQSWKVPDFREVLEFHFSLKGP